SRGRIHLFEANGRMLLRPLKPCFQIERTRYRFPYCLVRQKRCASIRCSVLVALTFCSWERFAPCLKVNRRSRSMKMGSGPSTFFLRRPRLVLIIHSLFTLYLSSAWVNLSLIFLVHLLLSRILFCFTQKPRCAPPWPQRQPLNG